jgi:copper chaperone NosL
MACSAPVPGVIRYDVDACDHCRMTIADPAFAAQLVTRTGVVFRFDDPACLVAFIASNRVAGDAVHSAWVNDHAHPDALVNVNEAVFVVSDGIRAPMNGRMAAFAAPADAGSFQSKVGGERRRWADIAARGKS